jgi:hypothetical protein
MPNEIHIYLKGIKLKVKIILNILDIYLTDKEKFIVYSATKLLLYKNKNQILILIRIKF